MRGLASSVLALALGLSACGGEDFETQFEREKRSIDRRGAAIDKSVQEQMAAQREADAARRELERGKGTD